MAEVAPASDISSGESAVLPTRFQHGHKVVVKFYLLPFPELPGVHSLHPIEETGEGGDFGEMELVGDLGDAQRGLAQEEGGLHQQHLVDIVNDGAAT